MSITNATKNGSSSSFVAATTKGRSLQSAANLAKIKKGAESANTILTDVSAVFKNIYGSGAKDAGKVLKSFKALGELGGSIFGALGVAFSIINLFIGGPDPMELLFNYMKEQFQTVNDKLDL